jgi:hypothetical protein
MEKTLMDKISNNISSNGLTYTLLLISLLLCMFTLYNAKGYEHDMTEQWYRYIDTCKCECLLPKPNVTFDIKIPIYEEIVQGDLNESKDKW